MQHLGKLSAGGVEVRALARSNATAKVAADGLALGEEAREKSVAEAQAAI